MAAGSYFCSKPTEGQRRRKIRESALPKGSILPFLMQMTYGIPKNSSEQMARFRERHEIDLCFTRFQNFWMPELAEEERLYRDSRLSQPQSAWSIATLLTRRATFDRFGLFDDGLRGNENMIWFLRAAGQGAVIEVISDVLMRRRFHSANDTRRGVEHIHNLLLPILKAWRDYQRRHPGT